MNDWILPLLDRIDRRLEAVGLDPAMPMMWSTRRRMAIIDRWPSDRVRAAQQDADMGDRSAWELYLSETAAIKAAVPKPELAS